MSFLSRTKFLLQLTIAISFIPAMLYGQSPAQKLVWDITTGYKANFGIAWRHLESGDSGGVNSIMRFPMQSVYKFPLALAVLDQVDKGKLKLKQKVRITKDDYSPDTWSPIMQKYPDGNVDLTLREVLMYNVTHSDNVACDILFKIIGGPIEAEKFIHRSGIKDIAMRFTEKEMHEQWQTQFDNWCTPVAMRALLEKFHAGKILSRASTDLLRKMMEDTSTGLKRIKGSLPASTVVAHRTGLGGRDPEGNISAVNDVGIITLPDNSHLALVVYISNSPQTTEELEAAIARISKELFDHYSNRQ